MSLNFEHRKNAIHDGRRRAILITGAASGMGLETARLFNRNGWLIIALDQNLEDTLIDPSTQKSRPGLLSLQKELGKENVMIYKTDVSKKEEIEGVVKELEEKLPGISGGKEAVLDIVFANAGIGKGGLWSHQPFQDHLDVISVNLIGVMATIHTSLPLLARNPGSLVFSTSSSSAMYGSPGIATYAATKHAVKGLTEALSIELDTVYKIRVADTLPGVINTPIMPKAWADASPATGPWRLIEPTEIANAVWASWLNDPSHVDPFGVSTHNRIHWYIPEELIEEVDAVVNTRGGTEKIREVYRETHWKGMEGRLRDAGVIKD